MLVFGLVKCQSKKHKSLLILKPPKIHFMMDIVESYQIAFSNSACLFYSAMNPDHNHRGFSESE